MARKGSVAMAARTAAYGKAAYGWAVKRGALFANPFLNLPVAPAPQRERVLSDDELAAIWRATDGAGPFNGIVRLLVLTGQRREEVAGMTWAELSDDFSTWTIPASRAKNGATHIVPLSAPAQDLLRRVAAPWRAGLPRPSRPIQRLVEGEGGPGREVRRDELAPSRLAPHGRNGPSAARGSPRSDGASSQPRLGKPRRHRGDISAPRLRE